MKRRDRGLSTLGAFGLVLLAVVGLAIAAGVIRHLIILQAERRRIADALERVEKWLVLTPDPAITSKYGSFVRMEGSEYRYPGFMSPVGDVLIVTRMGYFTKGTVKLEILVPGLSDPAPKMTPYYQIHGEGITVILTAG